MTCGIISNLSRAGSSLEMGKIPDLDGIVTEEERWIAEVLLSDFKIPMFGSMVNSAIFQQARYLSRIPWIRVLIIKQLATYSENMEKFLEEIGNFKQELASP
jgi:hypothetical protein